MMETLFQSGHIVFLILLIMLAEALLFAPFFKRLPGMALGLAAGACLLLALRAALLQQVWTTIALFLSLSFIFHIMEIRQWLHHIKQK
jgi:4-hydroxybenzoate polyprenyltransferase